MATTKYAAISGRLRAQESGGARLDYLTDAMGSVTATVNASQSVERTYRYKPFGAVLAHSGSGPEPRLLFDGSLGARAEVGNTYSYGETVRSTVLAISLPGINFPPLPKLPRPVSISQPYPFGYRICRGAEWCILWHLPAGNWKGKGAIIMHVTTDYASADCGQQLVSRQRSFYEAWEFEDGNFVPPSRQGSQLPTDCFTAANIGGDCTLGYAHLVGKVGFYYPFDVRKAGFTYDSVLNTYTLSRNPGIVIGSQVKIHDISSNCCGETKVLYSGRFFSGPIAVSESSWFAQKGNKCPC